MAPITPYTSALEGRDPLDAMRTTIPAVAGLAARWTPSHYERTYAPGKWSARNVIVHLAQAELALGTRARMALTTPDYHAQPFQPDAWMDREAGLSGVEAVEALVVMSRMNVGLFASLSDHDRATLLKHPGYGELTVDWIIHHMAGHQIHHFRQLQQIR